MNRTVWQIAVAAVVCALSCVIPGSATRAANPPRYVAVDLGAVVGNESEAYAINNRGEVVGRSMSVLGILHAFLWRDGVMQDLGTPGTLSFATGINDSGAVVGWATIPNSPYGPMRASLWQGGVRVDLHPAGALASAATGINNAGDIVGWYMPSGGPEHAAVWRNGVMTDLGLPSVFPRSEALAINDRGDIVGDFGPGVQTAFVLEDGKLVNLGLGYANAINNRGEVTMMTYPYSVYRNGTITPISVAPRAINEPGQIAGSCYTPATGYFACIVDGEQTINLGSFIAFGLNNRGDAVGVASVNGKNRATLWKKR